MMLHTVCNVDMYHNKYKILYKLSRNKRKRYYVPFAPSASDMLGFKANSLSLLLELLTVLISRDLRGARKILHAHKFKAPSVLESPVSRAQNLLCAEKYTWFTVLSLVS